MPAGRHDALVQARAAVGSPAFGDATAVKGSSVTGPGWTVYSDILREFMVRVHLVQALAEVEALFESLQTMLLTGRVAEVVSFRSRTIRGVTACD